MGKQLSQGTFSCGVGEHIKASDGMASGVPQESVLGPTLFIVFINQIADTVRKKRYLFADDMRVSGEGLEGDKGAIKF